MQFEDWEDLAAKGRMANAAVICVLVCFIFGAVGRHDADDEDALHAPLVEVFAKQGYHILCEKPMATTIADCVKMVKDVKASGGVFGMGHGGPVGGMSGPD